MLLEHETTPQESLPELDWAYARANVRCARCGLRIEDLRQGVAVWDVPVSGQAGGHQQASFGGVRLAHDTCEANAGAPHGAAVSMPLTGFLDRVEEMVSLPDAELTEAVYQGEAYRVTAGERFDRAALRGAGLEPGPEGGEK